MLEPGLASQTWSNRWGATLTPVATGVWAAERPFMWNGIDVGGRSTIARMPEGGNKILVHSPVEWSETLAKSLEVLGPVGAIVAPNYEHVKYISDWARRYPQAQIWGCPGLPDRMPEVKWTHELGSPSGALTTEAAGVEALHLDCEENPFTGRPFFNEVVFHHKKSKALFITDAFWNYPSTERPNFDLVSGTGMEHACSKSPLPAATRVGPFAPDVPVPAGTRLWKLGMDRVYLPFYKKLMVGSNGERRDRYMERVATLLGWGVEIIVPCHGDVVRGRELCQKVLQRHFLGGS